MSIDPKDYRQCWSCKYCEDVGTHTYEEYITYMRQCCHPRLELVDKCPLHCEHYEWDETRREYWKEPSSPSPESDSVSNKKYDSGFLIGILVIVGALVLIGVVIALINRVIAPKVAVFPESTQPTSGISTEIPAEVPTEDPADYALAGALRYVNTQSGNGVNMRSGPDANAEVVYAIPDNQSVTIQKTIGNWAYVSFDGVEGWCSMDYLITEEAHSEQMQDYLNRPAIVATESSGLRLRATPSLESDTIESMPKGSEVTILRMEGDWAYVDYQGMSGWCASKYLEIQE